MFENVFHSIFFWIFLGFYLVYEIVHFALDVLNYRHVKKQAQAPEFYAQKISADDFQKSKAYTLEKTRFGIVSHLIGIPFFWFLVFLGGFNFIDGLSIAVGGRGSLSQSVVFCLLIGFYFFIIGLPFKIYSTFVIEEKYGFNKTTFGLFVVDLIKSLVLSLLIGVPLLYLVFWFMNASGSFWWLWVWGAVVVVQLIIVAVYPTFLAPIFNKFKPLENESLKDKIFSLAKKINFKLSGVFVIDGSRRSSHSNAYFGGMGKYRRIVLFDTLMNQLTEEELLSVLAHEMGHNVKKHIQTMMFLSILHLFVGLYVMSLIMGWSDFYHAFYIQVPSHHTALVIFVVAFETFTFILTPLMNYLSRHHEYEADRFSVEVLEDKESMKSSLLKLTKENLSNLTPHPVFSFYHYSHPTAQERAVAIDKIAQS